MDYTTLPGTGITVSRICLGMMSYGDPAWQAWVLDEAAGRAFVGQALALGITFFDTADAYSAGLSEEILGRAVRHLTTRDAVVIATKTGLPTGCSPGGLAPARLRAGIDASLRRLGMDHVDLYQAHGWDPDVPIAETLGALGEIVRAGKARAIGACNFATWQLAAARQEGALQRNPVPLRTMQVQLNLLHREEEREMLPFCALAGVAPLAYSPLARGRLAGAATARERLRAATDRKARRLYAEGAPGVLDALARIAEQRSEPAARLALAWVLGTTPVAACIVGATEPGHLANAAAATATCLGPEERAALEAAYTPRWPELGDLSGRVS